MWVGVEFDVLLGVVVLVWCVGGWGAACDVASVEVAGAE